MRRIFTGPGKWALPFLYAAPTAQAVSGILLLSAAAVAIAWANVSPWTYQAVWQTPLSVGLAPLSLSKPLLLWVNDGLMALFFFVVGLEIKREVVRGHLASVSEAALPIAAAFGGMVAPATIYSTLNVGARGASGWGIPIATDIAFALGVLALLGGRVAPALRVFLTAVAIADDVGAIVVIALFYTAELHGIALVVAGAVLAVLAALNRAGVQWGAVYALVGVALWVTVLKSGVHATVAGVLLAFAVPATAAGSAVSGRPLLDRFEQRLGPWVQFAVMPVFALANAGVRIAGNFGSLLLDPVAVGVILSLFFGKQLGVAASCWALVRLRLANLPSGVTWGQLYGVALLCGIGFTMSLFVGLLAFGEGNTLQDQTKIGVLIGSLASAVAGWLVLRFGSPAVPRRAG